jgi:hypothetical protein
MITADFDMTASASYTHHSLEQRMGDDLAVFGKKTVGFLSNLMKGALEGAAFGLSRLAISAISWLTKTIDPGATDIVSGFNRALAMLDLPTVTLTCASEWAKGQRPSGTDIGAFDNNGLGGLVQDKSGLANTASLGKSGVKLNEAVSTYRMAHMDPTLANNYLQKIPTTNVITGKTANTFITKTGAVVNVAKASLGVALAIGDAIYSFVADGPGMVWEDTAAQAWETGGDEYEDCIMRHLHAVWPESIPAPDA